MRRVHVKYGLKQRINDIIGTDASNDAIPEITSWSVQAAILSNLHRIVTGVVGDATCGRVMAGLTITKPSSKIIIGSGYGFTPNGDVVCLSHSLEFSPPSQTTHYYLKHSMGVLPESKGGKSTDFVNQTSSTDIVFDDLSFVTGNDSTIAQMIAEQSSQSFNADFIYLGSVDGSGNCTQSPDRGLQYQSPTRSEEFMNLTLSGRLTAYDAIIGDAYITNKIVSRVYSTPTVFSDHEGVSQTINTGTQTLTFTHGLLTNVV